MYYYLKSYRGESTMQNPVDPTGGGNTIQRPDRMAWIIMLTLSVLVFSIYWPVQYHDFLNFDDQIYVTDNVHVRSGLTWSTIKWAFGSLAAGFWHPLTWLSLMLDSSLYGLNAGGFHVTNVLLHFGSVLLIFWTWRRMTGAVWQSAFLAALFAVHPLNVEPVAWIASRKDVLCGFFWMMTILAYVRYVELPKARRYLQVFLCFLLCLMSKPMGVTLPVVLLLLDYWPLQRCKSLQNMKNIFRHLVGEKMPFLFCAVIIGVLTFVAEHHVGAIAKMETIPPLSRLAHTLVSYTIYIEKMIIPTHLAAYYPHPGTWPLWASMGSAVLILLLTGCAIQTRKRIPFFFVGWFWYLLTLLPVIGIIQLGTIARADRYTYLPLIGLFIVVSWSCSYLEQGKHGKWLFFTFMTTILLTYSVTARIQVSHWQNSLTLFRHTAMVTSNNHKAYHALGMAYYARGDNEEAIRCIRQSLSIKAGDRAHNDLGVIYMNQKKYADAEKQFVEALRLNPTNARAWNNLGAALASQGKHQNSIPYFQEALRLDPDYEGARANLERASAAARSTHAVSR